MTTTLLKLAFAGIRSRLLASVLTVVLSSAAVATIVLALEVGATAQDPWQRTFTAANGAHVLANVPTEADARAIAASAGVAQRDEPVPLANVGLSGRTDRLQIAGLTAAPRVNSPIRVDGAKAPANGIVLERSFARVLGLRVGTTVGLATAHGPIELTVAGIAISPSQARYPRSNPGLAWTTRSTLERVEPDAGRWRWTQALRLADPRSAPAFAARVVSSMPPGSTSVDTWQDQRASALRDADPARIILTTYTIVLLVVVFVVVAILVGARATAQHREIGLLKAVGLTPRQVTAVFAFEAAGLGVIAVAVGFMLGALLAPRLAAASADTMLGSPSVAASPWHLLASCPVLVVLVGSARSASRRSTRFSVLSAIQAGSALPAPRSRFARLLARASLPIPLALGVNDLFARRHRATRLGGAFTVTGAAVVFALCMQASLDARPAGQASDVPAELPLLVYTLDAVLLLITATTIVAVALLAVRERVRDYAILKTIGLTPGQIAGSLLGAHAAMALIAAVVSVPVGIALYIAVYGIAGGSSQDRVLAPWWWLVLVPIGAVIVVTLATSLPARLATRIPTAEALRYE